MARTALSILAFPSETLDADIIYQMTRSAMEVFADAGSAGGSNSTVARTTEAWTAMLRSSAADGAIDAKTKEIITYALVILHRCGPCLQVHHEKALDMGITPEQLAEAMWLAVAIGGAPVKLFYDEAFAAAPAPAPQAQKPKGGCCQ